MRCSETTGGQITRDHMLHGRDLEPKLKTRAPLKGVRQGRLSKFFLQPEWTLVPTRQAWRQRTLQGSVISRMAAGECCGPGDEGALRGTTFQARAILPSAAPKVSASPSPG